MKTLASFAAMLFIVSGLRAEIRPPISYSVELNGGKHKLVMVGDRKFNPDRPLNKYPTSGLYHNDGSVEPIWTLPWFFEGKVFLSPDGDSMLALVTFGSSGVHYFQKGKLVRSYRPEDLTRANTIKEIICPEARWWHQSAEVNEGDVVVRVNDGRIWRFNIVSGEATPPARFHAPDAQAEQPGAAAADPIQPELSNRRRFLWIFASAAAMLFVLSFFWVRRRTGWLT